MGEVKALVAQAFKFGVVGLLATACHVGAFLILTKWADITPLYANFLAWVPAFFVSLAGHYYWTFQEQRAESGRGFAATMPRFLGVSGLSLALNTLVVWTVVVFLGGSEELASVFMATLVPAVIFTVSRWWAFA